MKMCNLGHHFANALLILFGIGSIELAQTAYLNCYNGTMANYETTPLTSPLPLIEKSCIDKQRKTVFFVFGLNGTATGLATTAIVTAYLAKGDVNILVLDWSNETSTAKLGTVLGYGRAVANAQIVAKQFARSLFTLRSAGLDFGQVHLIGHSLGAQLVGSTGNQVRSKQASIGRITGLDPAGPLFDRPISVANELNPNSASFVDIVHTNPRGYGTYESEGTVDFWPNYNSGGIQPGCAEENNLPFFNANSCSHNRCWMLFRESILVRDTFPAAGEPDFDTWIRTNGSTNQIAYLGEYISLQAKGNFYLVTNAQSPYGMGEAGTRPTPAETK